MQSGISVSPELRDAFNKFLETPSSFCLPVTITNEALVPLDAISFPSSSSEATGDDEFYAALPSLSSVIQPKTPIYLILRQTSSSSNNDSFTALTYIPSNSGVRAKTLFASTRATLVRDLGSSYFPTTVFAADEEEVLSESVWRERASDARDASGSDKVAEQKRQELMGEQERELYALRRAENETRNMRRRDIGIGGSIGTTGAGVGASTSTEEGVGGGDGAKAVPFPIGEGVDDALKTLETEGNVVLLNMDITKETLTLVDTASNKSATDIPSLIPADKPQYTFFRYPGSPALLFIYTCPGSSSIKDRMFHASSRASVLVAAQNQGLQITHKLEGSGPEEITADKIEEEVHPPKVEPTKRAFAKPRRPGR